MIRIGITHGDFNGVGYEVILKTLEEQYVCESFVPILYGSSKVAAFHRKTLELSNATIKNITTPEEASSGVINVINCISDDAKVEFGVSSTLAGEAAFLALDRCVSDYEKGLIQAIVTAPINKNNIQSDRFDFPGHTEYFEKRLGKGRSSLMILAHDCLKVALVTTHVPIDQVAPLITTHSVRSKIESFHNSLKFDFAIPTPKIAVLGLNPHAGDHGVIGSQDDQIISPAIKEAAAKGILCYGPYPADGFFGSGSFAGFDGVLAMYHDQGLIPFKLLAMEEGVNFTACLPVVRTSPAHGTAYDIAGEGIASESSFRAALFMALDVVKSRKQYREIHSNPLRKLYFEKGGDTDISSLISD